MTIFPGDTFTGMGFRFVFRVGVRNKMRFFYHSLKFFFPKYGKHTHCSACVYVFLLFIPFERWRDPLEKFFPPFTTNTNRSSESSGKGERGYKSNKTDGITLIYERCCVMVDDDGARSAAIE